MLSLPQEVEYWLVTTLLTTLIMIGIKATRHGRFITFELAEVVIARDLFAEIWL